MFGALLMSPDDPAPRLPRYASLLLLPALTRAATSTSSSTPASRRRHRRSLAWALSVLLRSSIPLSLVRLAEALTCVSPTSSTTVAPGQSLLLEWEASILDSLMFDWISAELYCMDLGGDQGGLWRSVSTVFSNLTLQAPMGSFQFTFPDCGALASDGSVVIVAQSSNVLIPFQETDTCYFTIQQVMGPMPLQMPPQSTAPPTATSTFPSTSGVARIPKIISVGPSSSSPSPTPSLVISSLGIANSPSTGSTSSTSSPPTSLATSLPTSLPSSLPSSPSSPPPTSPSASPSPGSGGSGSGTNSPLNSTGGLPVTVPPISPLLPDGNANPSANGGLKSGGSVTHKTKWIGPVVGGISAVLCLIIIVVFIMVIRRRRRSALVGLGRNDIKDIPWIITGGGAGAVMKESKKRFRIIRYPKEGHFYKMEDEEEGDGEGSIGEKSVDRTPSMLAATAGVGAMDTVNEKTGGTAVHGRQFPSPQNLRIESSLPLHMQGIPMHAEDSLAGVHSVSSNQSSYDASSVVRKYWEASMAARVGRSAHGGPLPTHDFDEGGRFDEGSIFDDDSRDSESRMADILSLRTTGSGRSAADSTGSSGRYRYRRSTLNSMGNSLFRVQRSVTTISSQSSFPDSLMITEEEFLERVRQHELQMQLEQDGQYYEGYSDSYPSRSTISRSSSIPSLTSSNDPFKTFDSNEVLLDAGPFADDRAMSRAAS